MTDTVKTYQQFIGGQWVDAASGATLTVENPAVGEVVARVPASGQEDVDRAVDAAASAFETWSLTTPQTRSLALLKIADILDANADELGRLESSQTGKPTQVAIDEMGVSSDLFRFFAGACRVTEGLAVTEYLEGHTSMVRRDPVGSWSPRSPPGTTRCTWRRGSWVRRWRPATPSCSSRRPARRCPPCASRSWSGTSCPPGVLNVLAGSGAAMGDLLVGHPKVRMVSITGDTVTGKHIARSRPAPSSGSTSSWAARPRSSCSTTRTWSSRPRPSSRPSYWNSGQDCTAACRVIAGPAVYDRFIAALADQVRTIKWGNPADADDLDMGSLIAQAQADKVEGMVNRALEAKAELVVGGHRPDRPGAYFEPTIIANPDQRSEIVQDEVFGPVVTVQRFSDEEQAVRVGERRQVRPRVVRVHGLHRQGDARRPAAPVRDRLDQRALHAGVGDPARRRQGVRLRQGRLEVRARGLHGREAHHDQHGRLTIAVRHPRPAAAAGVRGAPP